MASSFKNSIVPNIGTTETTVLSTLPNANTTVIGMSLTNLTPDIVLISIRLEDTIQNATAHFIKNVIIPPNQSLRVINGGEKLILGPSTNLKLQANVDNSLDFIMSFVEIT